MGSLFFSGTFLRFDFTSSSRSRFNSSPSTKLVDPLYQKYSVISFFSRLPMDIGCPVSCKFPHGTLHYQSRKVSFLLSRRFYFLPSASHVRIYSESFELPSSSTGFFPPYFTGFPSEFSSRRSALFLLNSILSTNFARHYFRYLG